MEEFSKMVTIEEAADQTNISKHCIKHLINQGRLNGIVNDAEMLVDIQQLWQLKESAQLDE